MSIIINDIILPDLPAAVDRTQYPYAYIVKVHEDIVAIGYYEYILLFSTEKFLHSFNSTEQADTLIPSQDGMVTQFGCNAGADAFSGMTQNVAMTSLTLTNFTLVWSDYDIVNSETGEIFFQSSVPKEVQKYSYNGVILPEIPVVDGYPYAFIIKNTSADIIVYIVTYTKSVPYVNPFDPYETALFANDSTMYGYKYDAASNAWADGSETSIYDGYPVAVIGSISSITNELIWSNVDIPKDSPDSTEIYLAASESIPFVESSTKTIKISDEFYKGVGDVCRNKLGVETLWKPNELPTAIRNAASLNNIVGESQIVNGVIYTESGNTVKLIGNIMIPGVCAGSKLDTVEIPESYTKISNYAFYRSEISTIKLPSNITEIGKFAFYYCDKLTSLTLPDNLKTINENAFSYSGLTSVTIPNTVTTIGNYAFYNSDLTKMDFSANVDALPTTMCSGCKQLTALILRKADDIYKFGTSCISSSAITDGTGYIYVPAALLDAYKATGFWALYASQFRAIEDYPEICG